MGKRWWTNSYSATGVWDICGVSSLTCSVLPLSGSRIHGLHKANSGHQCATHVPLVHSFSSFSPASTECIGRMCLFMRRDKGPASDIEVWADGRLGKCALWTPHACLLTPSSLLGCAQAGLSGQGAGQAENDCSHPHCFQWVPNEKQTMAATGELATSSNFLQHLFVLLCLVCLMLHLLLLVLSQPPGCQVITGDKEAHHFM